MFVNGYTIKPDANLGGANLQGADLGYANLGRADLRDANLGCANLGRAILDGAKLPDFQLPEGDIEVWKRCNGTIVKLLVPKEAKRTASLVGNKCRAEYARVLKVFGAKYATSWTTDYPKITYREGEEVRPHEYCGDPRIECAPGIHCFRTREEAEGSTF